MSTPRDLFDGAGGAKMVDGRILWVGASRLDGAPIVALVTGLDGVVNNTKTGPMAQTWILRRDVPPAKAITTGADESVCGGCIHRKVGGQGTCYVNPAWGPNAVWKAYHKGLYQKANTADRLRIRETLHVRFGAYGDPVAVPSCTWRSILPDNPKDATGYTHQWRNHPLARSYRDYLMASVELKAEALEAQAKGWRPFLVLPLSRQVPKGYAWCPSDALNPSKKVPCQKCGLCNGTRGRSSRPVAIFVHGAGADNFGVRERRANIIGQRREAGYDPLVRMAPALHAVVKKHTKGQGRGMKGWVAEAAREKLRREGVRPPK